MVALCKCEQEPLLVASQIIVVSERNDDVLRVSQRVYYQLTLYLKYGLNVYENVYIFLSFG